MSLPNIFPLFKRQYRKRDTNDLKKNLDPDLNARNLLIRTSSLKIKTVLNKSLLKAGLGVKNQKKNLM